MFSYKISNRDNFLGSLANTAYLLWVLPDLLLSQEAFLTGYNSAAWGISVSAVSTWPFADRSLNFTMSFCESKDTISDGELMTPESSVVSSDAKQLLTEAVSSSSDSSRTTSSTIYIYSCVSCRLSGWNIARRISWAYYLCLGSS